MCEVWISPSATPATQRAAASTASAGTPVRHQSPPSAVSATPATWNECGCDQVPRLPRETKVDVAKCHACHEGGCQEGQDVCEQVVCELSCVCVSKLYDDKLYVWYVSKLCVSWVVCEQVVWEQVVCVDKLCEDKLWVSKLCDDKLWWQVVWCDDKLWEVGGGRRRRRRRRRRDTEPKTRTPHKDVGNNFRITVNGPKFPSDSRSCFSALENEARLISFPWSLPAGRRLRTVSRTWGFYSLSS